MHLSPLFPQQQIYLSLPWYKSFLQLNYMIKYLLCWHSLTCFLFEDTDSFVKPLRNQFFSLFFRFFCLLLFIPNFHSSAIFFTSIVLFFFCFFFFSLLLHFFFLPLSVSAILTFSALVSITYHTPLGIFLSSLLLSYSQFQDCCNQAIVFPKSHSTLVHQSYQFSSFLYVPNNKYSPLLYTLVFWKTPNS